LSGTNSALINYRRCLESFGKETRTHVIDVDDIVKCCAGVVVDVFVYQVKGEKPPAPTRGLSKQSASRAGDNDNADDVDDDADATGDAACAAVDLVPRTDIRFAVIAVSAIRYLSVKAAVLLSCNFYETRTNKAGNSWNSHFGGLLSASGLQWSLIEMGRSSADAEVRPKNSAECSARQHETIQPNFGKYSASLWFELSGFALLPLALTKVITLTISY